MTTDIAVTSPLQLEDMTRPQETTSELSVYVKSTWTTGPVLGAFVFGMCIFGFVANLVMLISLLVYRKVARKTVNTFICNQTTLDLVAMFFWIVKLVLFMSGYLETKTGVLRAAVCRLIESDAVVSWAIYGSVYGLVVITFERYFKIVHPVAHRNHYRRWMTYVGVATPWMIGLFTSFVPSLTTAHFIDGTCIVQVYATRVTACAVRVALFSWRFVIPLVVFVVCYWKIISTLRRRAKVGVSQTQQSDTGQSTSAAAPSGHSKPLSKTQKNVIKTMIVVISCFTVCWLPLQFTITARLCGVQSLSSMTLYYALGVIAFVNLCANPFIYARGAGLYQFLRNQCAAVAPCRLMRGENQATNGTV